ncbi:LAFA_0G05952g1_1 [Lachancea sp. 'fantastica']|nr:LAFA_0G05952g1_1 [Lachancea sp. 'fantastica']
MSLSADFLSSSDSDDDYGYSYARPSLMRKRVKRSETLELPHVQAHRQVRYSTQDETNLESTQEATRVKLESCYDAGKLVNGQCKSRPKKVIDKTSLSEAEVSENTPIKEHQTEHSNVGLLSASDQQPKNRTQFQSSQEPTFEYGAPVDGYRFVGSRTDYETFVRSAGPSLSEQTGTYYGEEHSVDYSSDEKSQPDKTSDISLYMNRDNARLRAPIEGAPFLEDLTLEGIEDSEIISFLQRYATEQNQRFRELLKQERIAWHPDKAQRATDESNSQSIIKITRIFQAINSLWEKTH